MNDDLLLVVARALEQRYGRKVLLVFVGEADAGGDSRIDFIASPGVNIETVALHVLNAERAGDMTSEQLH